jgi:hypothetical protein
MLAKRMMPKADVTLFLMPFVKKGETFIFWKILRLLW